MNQILGSFSVNLKWLTLFGLWLLFLSGFLANFVGSPGILQCIRLNSLLETKKKQLVQVQDELKKLQTDAALLETNKIAQEREVRRTLGYAASDEIIFDFSTTH